MHFDRTFFYKVVLNVYVYLTFITFIFSLLNC